MEKKEMQWNWWGGTSFWISIEASSESCLRWYFLKVLVEDERQWQKWRRRRQFQATDKPLIGGSAFASWCLAQETCHDYWLNHNLISPWTTLLLLVSKGYMGTVNHSKARSWLKKSCKIKNCLGISFYIPCLPNLLGW